MEHQMISDKKLIEYIGDGSHPGSQIYEGCQAELNRRLSEISLNILRCQLVF